jgi:pSer/pThr/pTyr-binding forkhead associated (FHA) protein
LLDKHLGFLRLRQSLKWVMQDRPCLRHLSGSRANRVDSLVFSPEREITLGRDRECHVRYSETDELVSRKHLKIIASRETPVRYMAVDLGSRNGTFVNRQRVFGALALSPGARVQLGAGGPEFEFQLDTESERARTRVTGKSANPGASRNRLVDVVRRVLLMSIPVAAGAAAYMEWHRVARIWEDSHQARPLRHELTFDPHVALGSLVSIEAEWKVLHKETRSRLAHAYIANERISGNEHVPLLEGAAKVLPAFVLQAGWRIEPLLIPAGNARAGRSIGGAWSAKGVIVAHRAAVLTAAPAPLPWEAPYPWPAEDSAGALLIMESGRIKDIVPLSAAQFPRWVPAESGWLADELPGDLHGDVHGRLISRDDLKVEMAASVEGSRAQLNMTASNGSPGILAAAMPSGALINAGRLPQLPDTSSTQPAKGQVVWVVGKGVEAAKIEAVSSDGRINLRGSRCAEGGVVFDREGRVIALCLPEAHPGSGASSAILISRAISVSTGGTDGQAQ